MDSGAETRCADKAAPDGEKKIGDADNAVFLRRKRFTAIIDFIENVSLTIPA